MSVKLILHTDSKALMQMDLTILQKGMLQLEKGLQAEGNEDFKRAMMVCTSVVWCVLVEWCGVVWVLNCVGSVV